MPSRTLYETDFAACTEQQVALLRAGRLDAADISHIAEEIESLGRSEPIGPHLIPATAGGSL